MKTNSSSEAVLVLNLGTPDQPTPSGLRRYLKQFLMDPKVIDAPFPIRWMIVNLFVLPFRPAQSAQKYKSIWMKEGSPLLLFTQKIVDSLQRKMPNTKVIMGMRYGNPSLRTVAQELNKNGIEKVTILPLYPHYAMSSYETAVEEAMRELSLANLQTKSIQPWYDNALYIQALAAAMEAHKPSEYDFIVFSFHGIPLRHLHKTNKTGEPCKRSQPVCEIPCAGHTTCYYYQTQKTASLVAEYIGINKDTYIVSYQSRLGSDKWLTPSTENVFRDLPSRGVSSVLVVAPSFVTDGLETLEEIEIKGRGIFLQAGGKTFQYVPALNDTPAFIDLLLKLIESQLESHVKT